MTPRGLAAAVAVEAHKTVSARVPVVTAVLLIVGVAAICLSTRAAATSGDPDIVAKLGPTVAAGGWDGFLAAALQVTAAGSAGACGILLSWSVGREFSDGTIAGLFALPLTRATIVAAKLIAYFVWSIVVAIALTVVLVAAGAVTGLGPPPPGILETALRIPVLLVLTACMVLPVAWVATLSRGLLGGIATAILLVASAQVLVFTGAGQWYPPAAPALWALDPTPLAGMSVAVGMWVPVVFAALSLSAWRRLQLDR
ncbi:ABC transporter permease [Leifsonia sp. fls2-241-R2A-40a]|uniref:ABC transporter permease n=1 Tax=Leifsonia sp. fls2-241-R2A-40a TaxID=3040290 RepID=UPI0025502DF3|nr:ABC transporter permease [Leifsonia sp. fls2-241-R2A-40a]